MNIMGIFNNLDMYSNVDISEYIKQIQAGCRFKLDANNNYDIENKKLVNVAEGTDPTDAIPLGQLDAVDLGMCLSVGKSQYFQCKLIWIWEIIISIM